MTEDSYMLFKTLELGYHAHFCAKTYVTTERTADAKTEEAYKARTTFGIYQALKATAMDKNISINCCPQQHPC